MFEEANGHSATTGKYLRASWEHDKVNCKEKTKFYSDQRKNGMLWITVLLIILTVQCSCIRKRKCWESLEYDNYQNRYARDFYVVCKFCCFLVALAVYVRSPAAYEALNSFNVLQLPSKSTLQSYTGAFLHDSGACNDSIIIQVTQYKAFCQSCQDKGGVLPMSDGVLIFDEVKVISSMIWNSRSHHLVGLAMSPEEQASLQDAFQLFDPSFRVK